MVNINETKTVITTLTFKSRPVVPLDFPRPAGGGGGRTMNIPSASAPVSLRYRNRKWNTEAGQQSFRNYLAIFGSGQN